MEQKIKQDQRIQIGENIRNLRVEQNMTQDEVAKELQLRGINISRGTYSKIEMGSHHIAASTLEALKEIFHTTYDVLLGPSS